MENNKKTNKNAKVKQAPFFLVFYIVFAVAESSLWCNRTILSEQLIVIVLGLLVVTTCLYLIKNNIARFFVFLVLTILFVLFNYQYAFFFAPVGALLSIYKETITEERENTIWIKLYSTIFYSSVILSTVNFLKGIDDFEIDEDFLNAVLIGVILVTMYMLALKNMKNDRRNFKKSTKKPYTTVLIMATVGAIHTVITHSVLLHNRMAFFPCFLFLCVLIYEKDNCMVNFVKSLINSTQRMIKTNK